jgi:hypothetical protein
MPVLRSTLILTLGGVLAFAAVGAWAGNYHYGDTLRCSDCHVTHSSLTHDEAGAPQTLNQPPNRYLLKSPSVSEICLQCHDDQPGTPDVRGLDVNNPSEKYDGLERAAGQFGDGSEDNWKGHNLPGQGSESPGDCVACHDQHGNADYRNLRALDDSESGPLAYGNSTAAGLEKYRRANVGYVKNIGDKLCGGCHDFGDPANMLATGGPAHFQRHPSSGTQLIVTFSGSDAHVDPNHWVAGVDSGFEVDGKPVPRVPFAVNSAASYSAARTVSADNEVFCLSCHKAHGAVHAFSLVWPYGAGDPQLSASGCNQCHKPSG